ncbi:RNA polymerase subunit sigma-70 [Bradyrhizobium jicamae]|uniref:RNA polymerase subunit sigma-70 n=1 Tax=Bradyrhizobium jicamae TaxID=280332 RepID=A0A0R3L4P0_9BRAD|nr:sigma-70 family RNA polymerase sigma factor [Bradyrhizobium jicamae]KRR02852.1 RNA polymerase subunit sigma-70 [Bradyrhizobium jicamae]
MKRSDSRSVIFLAHRAALIDYATPILGSRESAEDIVQEAFLKFVPPRPETEAPEQPAAYLYRIVRNLSLDLLRRRKLESRDPLDETSYWAVPRAEASPEQNALLRDDIRQIAAILAEMPTETRIAVEMHRFGGHKLQDIAAHLGLSVATVHRMIHTALVDIAKRTGRDQT